ncbi:putative inorganic phosphate cotransporter [Adelges cooleyi]|uniref:putative inorganic phosphate cotransporter n=1 Tax=Adelges cooleyi TaxID=133065 RepID=UPI00217F8EE7|nr:putative inorganic phosphate cotransporter [Adelges cooleyi]
MDKRTLLWYMTFWGFAMNYMLRLNINIAIVSMIKHPAKNSNVTVVSECLRDIKLTEFNDTRGNTFPLELDAEDDKFDWDETKQSTVLSSFFSLHMIMQIPGGILAQRYGAKNVVGISNGLAAILSFAIPLSAKIDYKVLAAIRLIQGFTSGAVWPAMHTMTAKWIPVHERSRFVSAYLGSSIGAAVTYIMCGYVIAMFGWESVFHLTGVLGLLWYICWTILIYESPAEHPTIGHKERVYIENSIGKTVKMQSKLLPIPWKSMLTSRPLLINALTQNGGVWGLLTLATQSPTYFNFVLGLNIKKTGLWSGMPYIARWLFAFGFGMFSDFLIKSKKLTITNVRKLATILCNICQGLFILGICFCGCNSTAAIIMVTLATAVNGSVSSGPLAGVVDLAPNYAGVIQGIVGTITVFCTFFSPILVGMFTLHQQTLGQWNKVFFLTSGICCSTGLLYVFCGDSEIQNWNYKYDVSVSKDKEMKLIKTKSDNKTNKNINNV